MRPFMGLGRRQCGAAFLAAAGWLLCMAPGRAQVFVVEPEHIAGVPQFQPTHVELKQEPLTALGHQTLITAFTAEQVFARRPLPLGAHGLVLHANGDMNPGGNDYSRALQKFGVSAKIGDRVVITDVRIESKRIIFDFNGGPEKKHKYLRHVSVGMGAAQVPLAQDNGQEPVGSRLTLTFDGPVPEMTADQVKQLISPVLNFTVKSVIEAYTDSLPPKLKTAILQHQVLVGMDRKMVTYAVGPPERKVREQDQGTPFEEWIYGDTPNPTQFVRFSNNRVTRVEIAKFGESPVIRDKDETDGYLGNPQTRDVQVGDRRVNSSGESNTKTKAPTLRLPGEELPDNPMQPVNMPGDKPRPKPIPAAPGSGSDLASVQRYPH